MRQQRGFILVTTLWILAAMTLMVGFFALWSQRAVELAGGLQSDIQAEIDISSTKATLLYLFSTQTMNVAGLTLMDTAAFEELQARLQASQDDDPLGGTQDIDMQGSELRLDGRPYQGLGRAIFAVQDEAGLIGLNDESPFAIQRLLEVNRVSADLQAGLIDKYLDYIDLDDNNRLSGAEDVQYQTQKALPPTNRLLRTPQELRRVLTWNEQPELWANLEWLANTSTNVYGLPNINTAPVFALQSYQQIDAELAKLIVQIRETAPPLDETELDTLLGFNLGLSILNTTFTPGKFMRIHLWAEGQQKIQEYSVHITPMEPEAAPWAIEYALELPLPSDYVEKTPQIAQTLLFGTPLLTNPDGNPTP